MRSGNWPEGPVRPASARVTVDGVDRPVESVEIVREIPRVLPGQASGAGGITAATGTVEWGQTDHVTDRVATPWTSSDYPSRGQRVQVYATSDLGEHRIFTGMTNGTRATFADTAHSTDLVDDIYRLSRPLTAPALARIMPPLSSAADGRRRMIGMLPQYVTNRALRECGYYTTPPMDGYCVASAPLMGSTWPERGELEESYATADEFGYYRYNPTFAWSSLWGGVGTANCFASYLIDKTVYGGLISAARPLNISVMVGVTHRTSGYVAAAWKDSKQIRLAVTGTRELSGQIRAADGTVTTVVSMSTEEAADCRAATLRVELNSTGGSFIFRLRTDTGVEKTAAVVVPDSAMTSTPLEEMWVYAPDNRLGGAQVSFTSLEWTALGHVQNAWMDSPVSTVNLEAVPAIEGQTCLSMLKAQSEAEGSGFWIDEDGILRWKTHTQLTSGAVTRTLTAVRDLYDVAFRMDGQDARRRVRAKYRRAAVSTSRSPSLICHEGQRTELRVGDRVEEWIKPGPDEDWIQVDASHEVIIGGGGTGPANRGMDTLLGFTPLDADGNELLDNIGFDRPMGITAIGPTAWLYTLGLNGVPAGVDRVVTKTIDNTVLRPAYRNVGLPLVKAMGIVDWSDQEYSPGVTGPDWAPDLPLDLSWYVQDPAEVKVRADVVAQQLASPQPVVEDVDIVPDPRLQLGDKVMVDDPVRTGVRITGVITRIRQKISADPRKHTMSLRLLVTAVELPGAPTLEDFDQFYSGMTLSDVETLLTPRTLSDVDTYPLTD